ncbi:hypothetical protein ACFE04_022399 [Oxalis oulophora]
MIFTYIECVLAPFVSIYVSEYTECELRSLFPGVLKLRISGRTESLRLEDDMHLYRCVPGVGLKFYGSRMIFTYIECVLAPFFSIYVSAYAECGLRSHRPGLLKVRT